MNAELDVLRDALPPPTCCDKCRSVKIEYMHITNAGWKQFSEWPYIWFCHVCRAAVGCHINTNIPLGRMADNETRRFRARVHQVFDNLWKQNLIGRTEAYNRLAEALNVPFKDCHISWLTIKQLKEALKWSREFLAERTVVAERRKEKRINEHVKRIERTKTKIIVRKTKPRLGRRSKP